MMTKGVARGAAVTVIERWVREVKAPSATIKVESSACVERVRECWWVARSRHLISISMVESSVCVETIREHT